MPKIVLVDAHGYLHRAYHALPTLSTSRGEVVHAVYGFVRMLFKLLETQNPDAFAVCFESRGPTLRKESFPEYKAHRKPIDTDLISQFPLSEEAVEVMGLAGLHAEGYEADDVIATLATAARDKGWDVVIVSSDKDILQLVDERITVLSEPKQIVFTPERVREKWGVAPHQIGDVLSLMGDSSDNVPGVEGIGEKTAVKLIQDFGSLNNLLANLEEAPAKIAEKIRACEPILIKSAKLVSLETHVPLVQEIEACTIPQKGSQKLLAFLRRMEFFSLLKELERKNYFSEESSASIETPKISQNYSIILEESALEEMFALCLESPRVAVDVETTGLDPRLCDWVGVSLSPQIGRAFYIPVGHQYLGVPNQLSVATVIAGLKKLFARVPVVGHNLKFDLAVLGERGLPVPSIAMDTYLAAWCLEETRSSLGLKDLAESRLNETPVRFEDIVQLDKKSKTIKTEEVPVEKLGPYAAQDADFSLRLAEIFTEELKEKNLEKLYREVELPILNVLLEMEKNGIALDLNYLDSLGQEFNQELVQIEKEAHAIAEQEFNLNSSKQIAFLLFEKFQLKPIKKTKTGFSTDEEVLTVLADQHALPKLLLRHRELAKLKSTYIEGLRAACNSKTGKVHTHFNQAGTATGRLSSSDPNLQNIPIRSVDGRRIRKAFVPQPGNVFIAADYSQIDLRALAHLSEDAALCAAFQAGADIHQATAAQVFHKSLEEVTREERDRAKAINFGIVYGQQAFGLAQSLGIARSQAQSLIDQYFERYPGISQWMARIKEEARQTGKVHTLLGRVRAVPEIKSSNGQERSFAERIAINTPVQGTSADIIKLAMIQLHKKLKEENLPAKILLQVHDDLLLEVAQEVKEQCCQLLKEVMEHALTLKVPLKVEIKSGTNWADMKNVEGEA